MKIGHLIGLCNEVTLLFGLGIEPVFVLEGDTPPIKSRTVEERHQRPLQRQFKMDEEMRSQVRDALDLLGVPWVQAPEEAEAQGAYMTQHGCWGLLTTDYDSLLFGARVMIRSITGRVAEVSILRETLEMLGIGPKELILLGMMVGTDYNPGGIRGIGPRKALSIVSSLPNDVVLDKIGSHLGVELAEKILNYYLDPPVAHEWRSTRKKISSRARDFLVEEMELSARLVDRAIAALSTDPGVEGQRRIDHF